MKKNTALILTILLLLCSFSACGSSEPVEPVEYTIGEIHFSLPGDLEVEEDEAVAVQKMVDMEVYDSVEHYEELTDELHYLYGDGFDLQITTRFMHYSNDQLAECIENAYVDPAEDISSEDTVIADAQARIGHYTIDTFDTYYMYILKNGIYYEFILMPEEGADYPENYLENIAETVEFDHSLLETQDIKCGDIQVTVPENYLPLEATPEDDTYEKTALGIYDDGYTEFSMQYILPSEWSDSSVSDLMDILPDAYGLSDYERSTYECPLGTCEYVTGIDEAGDPGIFSMIEYDGKIYWINLYFGTENMEDLLHTILDTVTAL